MKLDDEESSLKLGEWWWSDEKENRLIFLVFETRGSLEDMIISRVFMLMISWEEKSNVFLGPEILFNELGDELEGRWLDPVFKLGKDLARGLNTGGRSSVGWLANSEDE